MPICLKNVKKSYVDAEGAIVPILDIPSLEVKKGEQVVLIGESGGGKTTLLNVISGISTPDAGEVLVDGRDIARMPEVLRDRYRAQKIGFVFQTFNLLPAFSALENVLLGMSFSGRKVDRPRAIQLLKRVGLGHRLNYSPPRMSVGEQQRIAVARGLANHPTLLLADEPTASVDLANQHLILELIRETCREEGCSLLLVTHSLEVAKQFERTERLQDFNRVGSVA